MSSEALEPPFDREQILGRVKVVERGETTLYERALLAEVARLEQERDERDPLLDHPSVGEALRRMGDRVNAAEAALAVAREREQRLEVALQEAVFLLDHLTVEDVAARSRTSIFMAIDAARTALAAEPAATLAEPGRSRRDPPAVVDGEASLPGSASAAADEPGETP